MRRCLHDRAHLEKTYIRAHLGSLPSRFHAGETAAYYIDYLIPHFRPLITGSIRHIFDVRALCRGHKAQLAANAKTYLEADPTGIVDGFNLQICPSEPHCKMVVINGMPFVV